MTDIPLLPMPQAYWGLWERTLLEVEQNGETLRDTSTRVFWLQAEHWHGDLRIPSERPDFFDVSSLDQCSDDQLRFIASQEGFCGFTRADGAILTWMRLHDLKPDAASPDVGRMRFESETFMKEWGVASPYLEHWYLVEGSRPHPRRPSMTLGKQGEIILTSGDWRMVIELRPAAAANCNPYAPVADLDREALLWRASLAITLYGKCGSTWTPTLSTHPWKEQF